MVDMLRFEPTFLFIFIFLSLSHFFSTILDSVFGKPSHSLVYSAAVPLPEHCVPPSFSLFWRIAVPEGDLAAKMRLCSIAMGKKLESPGGI